MKFRTSTANSKTLHPHKWFVPEALLLMQSDDRFRQQQCRQRLSTSNDNTDEWYKAVLQYIADDGTNEEEARRRLQERSSRDSAEMQIHT